uniref:Uncharacterized protein n=1 Tax=Fagus sylvatica TaxID=28930 RepID=A0A2N9F7P9_FAGSY
MRDERHPGRDRQVHTEIGKTQVDLGKPRPRSNCLGKPRPRSNRQPPRTTPRSRSEPVTNHHAEIEIGARITNKPNGEQRSFGSRESRRVSEQREQRSFGAERADLFRESREGRGENKMKREKEIG